MRLHWAGQQLSLDLQRARLRAVAENVDWRLVLRDDTYQVQRSTGAAYVDVGSSTPLPVGIRITSCTAPGCIIRFRPMGNAATFGAVTLRHAIGRERRVIVNIAGRVRVEG